MSAQPNHSPGRAPAPLTLLLLAAIAATLALATMPRRAFADPGDVQELARARALAANGRYREAADSLLILLDSSREPPPDVLAALAECHEGLAEWAAAADYWRQALAATTDATDRATLVFRRARALQQAGQYLPAARLYRLFVALRPDSFARDDALLRIADCYVAGGYSVVAIDYYARAIGSLAPGTGRVDALLRLADAYAISGRHDDAVALFARESASVTADDVPRYQFRWAQAERAAGAESAGLDRLSALFLSYPRSAYAHAALVELIDAGREVNEYLRGLVDYYAKAYEPAVAAFARYVEANAGAYNPAAHYYAGLSLRALKLYPEAVAQFDLLISGYPGDPNLADAMVAKAETLTRSGDYETAATVYLSLVDEHGAATQAPEALYQAAWLLERLGRADQAESVYGRLYAAYPEAEQAPLAALRAGLIAYRAARWSDAEAYMGQASGLCADCAQANRFRFWQARALLAQQRRDEAASLLTTVAGSAPGDYYSYRAWVLLQGSDPMASGSGTNVLLLGDGARTETEDWLRQTADASWQPGDIPPLLASDARFAAMQELVALGLRDWAVDLALQMRTDVARDTIASYVLAVWLRDNGLYRPSVQVAANIIYTHSEATSTVPAYIWSLAYPVYYSDLVLDEASGGGVDPLLFFAMVRQESLFDAGIGSSAGAQGLAQVIPSTGEWIASMLGDTDYETGDLLLPYVSIRYGVWYLAQQLAYLDDDPLAALAAYNAGPGNAATWANAAGGDPDVFYETIAFAETRRYLDTVVPNYYHYRRLYAAQGEG